MEKNNFKDINEAGPKQAMHEEMASDITPPYTQQMSATSQKIPNSHTQFTKLQLLMITRKHK